MGVATAIACSLAALRRCAMVGAADEGHTREHITDLNRLTRLECVRGTERLALSARSVGPSCESSRVETSFNDERRELRVSVQ